MYLDFEVVAARHKQRLLIVEANATHGPVMLVELLQQSAHAVVPQLDHAAVQTAIESTKNDVQFSGGSKELGKYLRKVAA